MSASLVQCQHHLVMCKPIEDARTHSMLAFGRCRDCRRWFKAAYAIEAYMIDKSTKPYRVVEVFTDEDGTFHEVTPPAGDPK